MNLFTRTFSKIFKSSNQQELDKIQNILLAVNDKESEIKSLTESDFKEIIEIARDGLTYWYEGWDDKELKSVGLKR